MKEFCLTPLKKAKNKSRIKFATSDFEAISESNDKFRCVAIYYEINNAKFSKVFFDFSEYMNFLFTHHFDAIYFYNLNYDSRYFIDYCLSNQIVFNLIKSGRILGLIIYFDKQNRKNFIRIKDFFPFCLSSLEIACKDFRCKTTKFNVNFNNCSNEDIKKHVINDVRMLYELITIYRNITFDEFSIDILKKDIYSLPKLSLNIYRSSFMNESITNGFGTLFFDENDKIHIQPNKEVFDFHKFTYRGGYCNAERLGIFNNVVGYDISSSYAFAIQMIRFPCGKAYLTENFEEWNKAAQKIPAFCLVTLEVPKNSYVIINRENKMIKACGRIVDYFCSYELAYYLSFCNVELIQFHRGYYYKEYDKHNTVAKYQRYMYSKKANSLDSKRKIFKRLLTSLYGKFGQSIYTTNEIYSLIESTDIFCREMDENVEIIDSNEKYSIIVKTIEKTSIKSFQFVSWSSLITAIGRIYLIHGMKFVDAIYSDTDSLYFEQILERKFKKYFCIPEKFKNQNKKHNLGYFMCEHKNIDILRGVAPKLYAFRENWDEYFVKAKGIPHKFQKELFYEIILGLKLKTRKYLKIMGITEGMRAKNYKNREMIVGGIRETQKILNPKNKVKMYIDEVNYMENRTQLMKPDKIYMRTIRNKRNITVTCPICNSHIYLNHISEICENEIDSEQYMNEFINLVNKVYCNHFSGLSEKILCSSTKAYFKNEN